MYKPPPDPVAGGGGRSPGGGGSPGGSTTNSGGGENIKKVSENLKNPYQTHTFYIFAPPEIGHGNVKRHQKPLVKPRFRENAK